MVRVREIIQDLVDQSGTSFSTGAYGDEGLFDLCLLESLAPVHEAPGHRDGMTEVLWRLIGDDPVTDEVPSQALSALILHVRKILEAYIPLRMRLGLDESGAILHVVQETFAKASGRVEPQMAGRILDGIGKAARSRGLWTLERGGDPWLVLQSLDLLWVAAPFLKEIRLPDHLPGPRRCQNPDGAGVMAS